jgi:hypothetical protein
MGHDMGSAVATDVPARLRIQGDYFQGCRGVYTVNCREVFSFAIYNYRDGVCRIQMFFQIRRRKLCFSAILRFKFDVVTSTKKIRFLS